HGGFIDTSAAHVRIADTLKVTTAAAKGLAGTWLIDPSDFNIAARGGDMSGAFLSNSLKSGNVQIQSISGAGGTQGNINVNDTVAWSANKLTLTAQNNININTAMRGSGSASLALEYGQSSAAGTGAAYNVKAEVDLPSGNNFSTRQGSSGALVSYKVINSLGAPGSVTSNDLQGINGGLNGNYVLGSNIDATATSGWNGVAGFLPLGSDSANFTGKFDGLGHVINNLKINRNDVHTGLFGVIGSAGSVSNLGLAGGNVASVAGGAYLGLGMLAGLNQGLVSNSYSSGSVTAGSYSEGGGLVGQNQGIINNSHSSATLVHNDFSSVGGLVGHNLASAQINNSYASGTVTTVNGFAGGLVGLNQGAISKSFATGAVSAGQFGGGLVAFNRDNNDGTLYGSVDQSYATGSVNAGINAGGLVGFNGYKASISNSYSSSVVTGSGVAGGIVGLNNQASISNSYATGKVSGNSQVGGVVGFNTTTGTVTNVYASGVVSGNSKVGGVAGENSGNSSVSNGYYNTTLNAALNGIGTGTGTTTGLSSTQMKSASNFAGFTFTTSGGATGNNWVMVNSDGTFNSAIGLGATLPMLSSEWSTTITSAHQLQLMGLNLSAQYLLANDINAARTASSTLDVWNGGTFVPVGTGNSASTATHFNGGLDGAFHVITGLTINRPGQAYNGLFGTLGVSSVVKSLGLEGGGITAGVDSGVLAGDSFGAISNVYSTVAVSGGQRTGGLVGAILGGSVSDSYASGSVTGSNTIVGGLAGRNDGAIINSYASGAVSGTGTTGGLAGDGAGTVSNSFWDRTSTGQNTSGGGLGVGLSTAQMKTLANFNSATIANGSANPNWELATSWVVYDGNSYPLLRGFMKQLAVKIGSAIKTYDGLAYNGAGGAVYSNLTDSDLQGTLVFGGAAGGAVNAGNYAISGSGLYSNSGQHGYSITYIDGALTVNKLAIALNNAAAGNKTYDGSTAAIVSGNLSGVLAGDIGNVTFSGTGSYADKNAGNNKVVTANATLGGSAGGNYTLAPISGLTGNIGKATISGVGGITAGNKVYDGSLAASLNTAGASFTGMIAGDNLTVSAASGNF
ncbi:beta strand repeat-containing protein, partial [Janthinobacterium agaricidamnosum]